MSYNHESDPQQAQHEDGADPTEAYQATAEWDAVSQQESWEQGAGDGAWEQGAGDGVWEPAAGDSRWEQAAGDSRWEQGAGDGAWEGSEHDPWDQREQPGAEDPSAQREWDDERDGSAGGVTAAKQTISGAADKITRWFAGLDRRPEYEDQYRGADPVAELVPGYESTERAPALTSRERGASGGRRAAASRAIAANRRRSVATAREGAASGGAFGRGSAHAARAVRGGRRDRPMSPPPIDEPADEPLPELMGGEGSSRFPVAPLGYNRQAVDEQFVEFERELTQLREALAQESHREAPMTIQEELERIGEETASILVVAHDKAHETTRMAEEQAERCISDAAANAVSITEEAQRKLREIEAETDVVRRCRERLIADVRSVSTSLVSLANEAEQRFAGEDPEEAQPAPNGVEPAEHGPASAA